MNYRKTTIIILGLLIITNTPPITSVLKILIDENLYRYSNGDGSYTFQEIRFKGRNYKKTSQAFNGYLTRNPEIKEKELFRLFKINPLAFWRYGDYLFHEKYRLKFRDWNTINKMRNKSNHKIVETDF